MKGNFKELESEVKALSELTHEGTRGVLMHELDGLRSRNRKLEDMYGDAVGQLEGLRSICMSEVEAARSELMNEKGESMRLKFRYEDTIAKWKECEDDKSRLEKKMGVIFEEIKTWDEWEDGAVAKLLTKLEANEAPAYNPEITKAFEDKIKFVFFSM